MAKTATYTAEQFIDACRNSGGVISTIAARVGCEWHTAKTAIEKYPTVKLVYDAESNRVSDKAKSNVIKSIMDGDLETSKWWLRVKMPDEFAPAEKREISGAGGAPLQVEHSGTVKQVHEVDSGTAETIFDILAASGAIKAATDATETN